MKVQEVFNTALSLMSEENGEVYKPFVIEGINQIMADLKYLTDMDEDLRVASLSDEIPYPEKLVRECFSYGLCVYLLMGDDELQKAGFFDNRYAQAQALYAQNKAADFVEVVDVYA